MNLLSLVEHLRINILHDTGGTNVDWASLSETDYDSIQLRWSNEEITRNINEAITQAYRRIQPIEDLILLPLEAGVTTYALNRAIQKVVRVRNSYGREVKEVDLTNIWYDSKGTDNENVTVTPEPANITKYVTNYTTGIIKVYPLPTAPDVLQMLVYRFPLTKLTWDKPNQSPEIREEYQIPLLYWAAHLCYLKDEQNTIDPTKALLYERKFDSEFPMTSVYSNVRKSRTSNRPIRYGGY